MVIFPRFLSGFFSEFSCIVYNNGSPLILYSKKKCGKAPLMKRGRVLRTSHNEVAHNGITVQSGLSMLLLLCYVIKGKLFNLYWSTVKKCVPKNFLRKHVP